VVIDDFSDEMIKIMGIVMMMISDKNIIEWLST